MSELDSKMVSGYIGLGNMDTIALKENNSENCQLELKNALTGVLNNAEQKRSSAEREIQYLKELITSHLDIIQQQSEQLTVKDRLISKLKNEKETLMMRLVRMDRRVNLEKSRRNGDESNADEGYAAPPTPRPVTPIATAMSPSMSEVTFPQPPPLKKHRKRHSSLHPFPTSGDEGGCSDGGGTVVSSEGGGDGVKAPVVTKLMTRSLYHTTVGEQECIWGVAVAPVSHPKPSSNLEVPSWRLKSLTSSYTMEGTENLSDEAFDRRHSNLFKDERRRKRWDVQRIREMRHNEKLRLRHNGGAASGSAPLCPDSLWPSPTRHTQLIVQTCVPVAAFGLSLPNLPHRDFTFSSYTLPTTKQSRFSLKRAKR